MPRFGVKEVADVTFYNLLTNKPELYLDTLKLSNLENAAESTYATGGKGAGRLVGWDYGRTATFNIQDALLNPKALSMQLGTELESKIETIYDRIVLVAVADGANSKVTLPVEPKSVTVFKSADGYGHDEEVDQASITVTGAELTFPTAAVDVGDKLLVYFEYDTIVEAEVITIKSDKFGGYYKVVGKTLWRSEATGKDEMVQIVIPKAKITSQFSLIMQPDGDPSVFDMNLDVFKEPNSTDMVKIVRYGVA